jgi:hypothetical protein
MGDTGKSTQKTYVTLGGLPLLIELKYPFHKSGSGADFWVLHGDIQLGNSEGLHAPVGSTYLQPFARYCPRSSPTIPKRQ